MGRIVMVAVGLVVGLVVGFGVGWAVASSDGGGETDADRACAAAEELPDQIDDGEVPEGEREERIVLLNRIAGIGWLAQAAGQDGPDPDDLDELGEAGRQLYAVVSRLSFDDYPEARDNLLGACDER